MNLLGLLGQRGWRRRRACRTRTPVQFRRGYPTWRPGDEIFLNPTSRLRVVAVDAGTLTVERVERLDR
jgi:hypothetical protein